MATKTFAPAGVIGLYTETPLHCGTESAAGYVDLPIQRERHTDYPVIQGSTIKGILRDECKEHLSQEELDLTFGTGYEPAKKGDNGTQTLEKPSRPGSVSFGDGILVAFPVRSSKSPFHWITCPFVLERAFRALGQPLTLDDPVQGQGWTHPEQADTLLLEDLRVEAVPNAEFFADDSSPIHHLLALLPAGDEFAYSKRLFARRLLIVSNTDFQTLVQTCTHAVTRIQLNAWGTTGEIPEAEAEAEKIPPSERRGNLFVEELVPPETLFLSVLRASQPPAGLCAAFGQMPVIRLGGGETIGRGVTHLHYLDPTAEQGSPEKEGI